MPPGFLTDEEEKLAQQARDHGFGDDDDESVDDAPAAPADEPAAAAADPAPAAAADEPAADEPAAEPPAEERPQVPTTFAPTLHVQDPANIDSKLKAVAEQRMNATKAWRAGEIDDDAYDSKLAELEAQKDELIEERAIAKASIRINEQTAAQVFQKDMDNFLSTMTKYEGVPYKANSLLMTAFRNELAAAGKAALDAKEDPSSAELFERAHKAVLEQAAALGMTIGKKPAAPAPAPAPASPAAAAAAQAPAGKPAIPPNLGKMPSAAPAPTGSSMDEAMAQLAGLEGEDLELAVAKLPADVQRRLMMAD